MRSFVESLVRGARGLGRNGGQPTTVRDVLTFPLVGSRIELRPFTLADAPAMLMVYGDPQVMRWVGHGAVSSLRDVEAMLRQYMAHQQRYGYAFWAVVDRRTGDVLGDTGLARTADGKLEMGYTFARKYWGQGYATESASLALAAAFGPLGASSVRALVEAENMASRHVLSKLGFRPAGEVVAFGRPHLAYELTRP